MKPASLIGHVIEAYRSARFDPSPADSTIRKFFQSRRYLGSKDRRIISDLVYGMLRHTRLLEFHLARCFGNTHPGGAQVPQDPLFLYAAYAVIILKHPPRQALNESSPLWEKTPGVSDPEGLVTALAESELPDDLMSDPVERNATVYSVPIPLVREWVERFGDAETGNLCASLNTQAPITVRVNTLRSSLENARQALSTEGVENEPTSLSPDGLVLKRRFRRGSSESFRRGYFEMQDEGSQLIAYLAHPAPGSTVIDACAGSGGKALHMAALMENKGRIIASDISRSRLMTIAQRSGRAGVSIIESVWSKEKAAWSGMEGKADVVLIDAPCSGSGTFRRNPSAKLSFSSDRVTRNIRAQKSILSDFARMVRPGGRLVYATCSLTRAENEDVVTAFLNDSSDYLLVPARQVLADSKISVDCDDPFLHLFPHRHNTDGFFGAVLVRSGEAKL